MSFILLLGIAVVAVIILGGMVVAIMSEREGEELRSKYQYTAKNYFLTKAENQFYNALGMAVGHEYRIFAQVHLGSILDEKVKGQDWRAARAHINRRSVDFLLCDKEYLSPKLAIELDDKSHEKEDRKERDEEVERILKAANIPLVRIQNHGKFEPEEIAKTIQGSIRV